MLRALLLMLLLTACAGNGGGNSSGNGSSPAPPPPPTTGAPPATGVPSPSSAPAGDAQPAIDAALQDAAAHLNVGAGALHVEQVDTRSWPDASLGCPRQGQLYAQVVTPGYLIVISGAGKDLEYHVDARGRTAILCAER
jgi:hypothetical protein